jgi:RHS repeat-associated protein
MNRQARWLMLLALSLVSTLAQAGTRHYYYTPPLGTPLAKTDASGNIIASYEYTPYGVPVTSMGVVPDGVGYTGHVNDPETGLVYMQARYYDPAMGRFLSVDPVGPSPGELFHFNRYDYTNNNPINHTDPDGRCPMCIGALIGAGIEIGMQLATDGRVSSWKSVAVSAGVGAVTGGLGGIIGKAAVSGAITTSRAVVAAGAVGSAARARGKVVVGGWTGNGPRTMEVGGAAATGGVGGATGAKIGLNAVAKLESMAASNGIAGTVGRTTQAAVQQGGKTVGASTSFTQKAAQTTTDAASSYVEKKVNHQ